MKIRNTATMNDSVPEREPACVTRRHACSRFTFSNSRNGDEIAGRNRSSALMQLALYGHVGFFSRQGEEGCFQLGIALAAQIMQFLLGAHGHQLAHVHNTNAIGHFLGHAQAGGWRETRSSLAARSLSTSLRIY